MNEKLRMILEEKLINYAPTMLTEVKLPSKTTIELARANKYLVGSRDKPNVGVLGGALGRGGKWNSGLAKGGLAGAAVLGGIKSASTEWQENKDKGIGTTENVIKTGVRTAGGAGGALGGAMIGARIGSKFGAIGRLTGGVIGGVAGWWAGDKLADAATNINDDNEAIKDFRDKKSMANMEKEYDRLSKIQDMRQTLSNRKSKEIHGGGNSTDAPGSNSEGNVTATNVVQGNNNDVSQQYMGKVTGAQIQKK